MIKIFVVEDDTDLNRFISSSLRMAIAYPVYKSVLKKYKNRYGDEILRLSEELLNENDK